MHRCVALVVAALAVIVTLVPGCARLAHTGVTGIPAAASPGRASLTATRGPDVPFREFTLKGSFEVRDHTERVALLERNTLREYPTNELWLLDLATGDSAPIRTRPVDSAARFAILGYKVSDAYVAWEEVSANETGLPPEKVRWRLYAAPIDAMRLTVGAPRLIDEAVASRRTRPLFGIDGTRLVWMTNDLSQRDDGERTATALVHTRDLSASRGASVIATFTGGLDYMNVSEGRALCTPYRSATGDAYDLALIDLRSGARVMDATLSDTSRLVHVPTVHDGWVAWSVRDSADTVVQDLYIRDAGGHAVRYAGDIANPCFAGDFLFFESNETRSEAGSRVQYPCVSGVRIGTRARFSLVDSRGLDDGWWHVGLPVAYHARSLIVARTYAQSASAPFDRTTLVRVYDLRHVGAGP